jgi:glycosyltransferase involved in cell wall biosynthesis
MAEGIHIVSFDVPFPPDYGGVIDVYYKAKALAEQGLKVSLHCFQYGRAAFPEFEAEFFSVKYYTRRINPSHLISREPFIVKTRRSEVLLDALCENDWPILFEGLHTCAWIDHPRLEGRQKLVRAHNVEHEYYATLAKNESNLFRKRYFKTEARKLRGFEKKLKHADHILTLSESDQGYFHRHYPSATLVFPFHPEMRIPRKEGKDYAFYHGKLEVSENKEAVRFLVNEVFKGFGHKLVIAGKGVEADIREFRGVSSNVEFHLNPSDEEMADLASGAAVHVLPTFQQTGFKLKLLYSLHSEVEVVANRSMVAGTGLEGEVHLAETAAEFQDAIAYAIEHLPSEEKLQKRMAILRENYSNQSQAAVIVNLLR